MSCLLSIIGKVGFSIYTLFPLFLISTVYNGVSECHEIPVVLLLSCDSASESVFISDD